MKTRYVFLTGASVLCLSALSIFIVDARGKQHQQYTDWYQILSQIQLETNSVEKALLSSRLGVTPSYDEISSLSQSLYVANTVLEKLESQNGSVLNPATRIGVSKLRQLLVDYRNTIFDFQIEISTLRSATNVFYRTQHEISAAAELANIPRLGHLLLQIEESLLIDHSSTDAEKKAYTDGLIALIERDYADFLPSVSDQWLLIQADRDSILLRTEILKEITAKEEQDRAEILTEIGSLLPELEIARRQARIPEIIATALLITGLCGLVVIFFVRSTKFSRQLKHHADELENIVALRTEALEMAMEDLKQSTAEKEKIAEDLRLSQRLEAIGQLAAGIAHEINTPSQYVNDNLKFILEAHTDLTKVRHAYAKAITEITGSNDNNLVLEEIQDLEDEIDLEFLQEEVPSALKNSLDGMERISKIVKSMKDFSHPGSEGRDLIDINQALETTLSVASNEWKYCATIERNFEEALPKVPIFATELNQVLLNIVVNAAHAIEQKRSESDELGTISLTTGYDKDYVSLRIRDSGCGIPKENIQRIFDPFYTTKEVGKGTGQGLSIARKIVVDTHGGLLDVTSELGKFTEFHIRLPQITQPSESPKQENVISESTMTETTKI